MAIHKNNNDEKFSELSNLVSLGLESEIADWFNQNINKNKKLEKELTTKILNAYYFFSFSSSYTLNKNYLENERLRRELCVLSHLRIENQLLLFNPTAIDVVTAEHFSVIKNTKKNRDVLCSSGIMSYVVTKLFHKEKFSDLDKINKKFGLNFLEQKNNNITFCYEESNSNGSFFLPLEDVIFKPKYDIAFLFSPTKKLYLEQNNIELPTVEEITELKRLAFESFTKNNTWYDRKEYRERIEQAVASYVPQKTYIDLQGNLGEQAISTKKKKI